MKLSEATLWDMIIIHIIYIKLDKVRQGKSKQFKTKTVVPELNEFLVFMKE